MNNDIQPTQASQTPWTVDQVLDDLINIRDGADSPILALCNAEKGSVNNANARLIVRAVNCHEELVKALQNTLSMLTLLNVPGMNDPIEARVYQARAALDRAKEGRP